MQEVYVKINPLDKDGKKIDNFYYSLNKDMFVKLNSNKINNIPFGKFFVKNGSNFEKTRKKQDNVYVLENEYHRDILTLKRNVIKNDLDIQYNYLLAVFKYPKNLFTQDVKNDKIFFDPLNNVFVSLTKQQIKDYKIGQRRFGSLIYFDGNSWEQIKINGLKNIPQIIDESLIENIVDIVSDNFTFFLRKKNLSQHCKICVSKCKQYNEVLFCKNFQTEEGVSKKRFAYKEMCLKILEKIER